MAVPLVQVLRLLGIALLALPAMAFSGTAGSVLISVGEAEGERWDEGEPQLGIDLSLGPRLLPFQLAAYAAGSRWSHKSTAACECGPIEHTVGEAGVGVQGVWTSHIAYVSLGAGPAWSQYHYDDNYDESLVYSATYRGTGWWAGANALIRSGSHLAIGGGARYTRIEYDPVSVPIYAWSFHGSIGWIWPGGE